MPRHSTVSDSRPVDLLAQPPSVRIQYFKDFAIAHPLLVEAKDRLLEAIMESAPNSLVIVLGPTGVGKTTLLAKIRQLLRPRPRVRQQQSLAGWGSYPLKPHRRSPAVSVGGATSSGCCWR